MSGFRFLIVGNSDDANEAIEKISDIIQLEEATSVDELFICETQEMRGMSHTEIGQMNILQQNGTINSWSYHNKQTS